MKNEIKNFIDLKENKSKLNSVDEIVGVCKRINNSKRDFLFVNKFQGKHVPQSPSRVLKLFDEFAQNIKIKDEKVLVIGFAETATAIGNYVSAKLPNCIYEMQTTREIIHNQEPIVEFKEEHCHAPTQLLYGDKKMLFEAQTVLFVEDEITTGKTIINFINELNKINPNLKYAVASILNWQDEESSALYKKLNIDTYYLIKGEIKDLTAKVDIVSESEFSIENNTTDKIRCTQVKSEYCSLEKTRLGRNPIKDIELYGESLYNEILKSSELLNEISKTENKNILVMGTEELMYEPLLLANYLEKNTNNIVLYHATTRSPIEVSNQDGYILKKKFKFSSCYDQNRTTYIYNLDKYDYVLIVTDGNANDSFVGYMSNIFSKLNYNLNVIEIIKLGG